ncbi:MAG: hypothetical protein AAF389_14190 [Gemmatimonadota bacterium]
MSRTHAWARGLLESDDAFRYVAVHDGVEVVTVVQEGSADQSSVETDRYEELLVNPTVLTILERRGDIDCGGLEFVVIRYGHFFQVIRRLTPVGHVSVAVDPDGDPLRASERIREAIGDLG